MPISSIEPSMQCSPFFEEVEGLKEVVDARVSEREGVGVDGERIEYQSIDFLRYEENFVENSPSFLFSIFGRPLLSRGSSRLGGSCRDEMLTNLELLRLIAADEREWVKEPNKEMFGFEKWVRIDR